MNETQDQCQHSEWYCGDCGLSRDADHCTPEERAVIEAALRRRRLERRLFPLGAPDSGHGQLNDAFIAEQEACDVLFTARTKKESSND